MNRPELALARRARVAVAAYLTVLVAVIVWGTLFAVSLGELRSEFNAKSGLLTELRARGLSGTGRDGAARPRTTLPAIAAPSETVAAGTLQKEVLSSLADAGGSVHSIQAEATSEVTPDGLRRLNVQLICDGSTGSLQRLLFALETFVPFIFVDSLVIQPVSSTAPGSSRPEEALRVTLEASSYWKSIDYATTVAPDAKSEPLR